MKCLTQWQKNLSDPKRIRGLLHCVALAICFCTVLKAVAHPADGTLTNLRAYLDGTTHELMNPWDVTLSPVSTRISPPVLTGTPEPAISSIPHEMTTRILMPVQSSVQPFVQSFSQLPGASTIQTTATERLATAVVISPTATPEAGIMPPAGNCPAPVGSPVFQTYDQVNQYLYVVRQKATGHDFGLIRYRGTELDRHFGDCGVQVFTPQGLEGVTYCK